MLCRPRRSCEMVLTPIRRALRIEVEDLFHPDLPAGQCGAADKYPEHCLATHVRPRANLRHALPADSRQCLEFRRGEVIRVEPRLEAGRRLDLPGRSAGPLPSRRIQTDRPPLDGCVRDFIHEGVCMSKLLYFAPQRGGIVPCFQLPTRASL